MDREHNADKLRDVPLTACVQDQRCSGNGIRVTHETILYMALDNAVYSPVNQAAKHLGLTLKYGPTRGKQEDLDSSTSFPAVSHMLGQMKCNG